MVKSDQQYKTQRSMVYCHQGPKKHANIQSQSLWTFHTFATKNKTKQKSKQNKTKKLIIKFHN